MSKRHLFIAALSACAFASTVHAGLLGGGGGVGGTLSGVVSPSNFGIGGQGQGNVNGILNVPRLPKAERAKDAASAAGNKAADAAANANTRTTNAAGNASASANGAADNASAKAMDATPKGEARASASGNSSGTAASGNSASAGASFSADGSVR